MEKNKKPWCDIRDIDRNEALTWSKDRLKEELKEQKRRHKGFSNWFNSSASRYAKRGKWGYYNQQQRGIKIWENIQYLELLLSNSLDEVRVRYLTTRDKYSNDSSSLQLETRPISKLVKWIIGLGIIGSLVLVGKYSCANGSQNKKIQPEIQVARKYNLNEKSLVRKPKADFSWIRSSKSSESYRRDIALYRLNKREITPKLEENLISLAKLMESKKKEIRFNDYTKFENNIWVAGESRRDLSKSYSYLGFICYSPDCGNTWFEQLRFGPWSDYSNWGGQPDVVPLGIFFFDSKEGWSFTRNSILHTIDGGRTWNQSYRFGKVGGLKQLHVVDRQHLVAMSEIPTVIETEKRVIHSYWGGVKTQMEYTIDGGRTWKSYPEWKPEILGLEAKLIGESSIIEKIFSYNK